MGEMIQIPLYRAKNKKTKKYAEGYLIFYEIDPETLAFHLPNMLDKNKRRIFASLNKDDKKGAAHV